MATTTTKTTTTKTTTKAKPAESKEFSVETYILNKLEDLNKRLMEAEDAVRHGFDRRSVIDTINGKIEICKDILNALKR